MAKGYFLIIILGLGILSLIFLKKTYEEFFTPKIAVTLYPFYDITKEIVGDRYDVILIMPPGAEPHNFELRPQDLIKLRGVKIIFSHGMTIDKWVNDISKNLKEVKIVPLYQSVNLIDEDPHFWLSIENMKKIAQKIAEEMKNFDPQNKESYEKNFNNVLNKLDELLNLAQIEAKNFHLPYLITQHDAFQYLAKELNLKIIGALEGPHRELTPTDLKKLIDSIRIFNIKVIFKEPGEESNLLKTLAKEFNLKIYELNPIEGKSGLNYFEAYRKNIETLKEALR